MVDANSNPTTTPRGLPTWSRREQAGSHFLEFTQVRRKNAAKFGLQYRYKISPDLQTWDDIDESILTVTSVDSIWERVTFSTSMTNLPQRFIALQVELDYEP